MPFLPSRNSGYLQSTYWNKRFETETTYDWCKTLSDFGHLFLDRLNKNDNILIIGSGNSSLTKDLYDAGFKHIMNSDISEVALEMMSLAMSENAEMDWTQVDMMHMPYKDGSFDVVIEKGTMDVLFVDNDSPWEPRQEVLDRVKLMLDDTHRILKKNGLFISITFAQPHFRKPLLLTDYYDWNVEVKTFGETFHYFVYLIERGRKEERMIAAKSESTDKKVDTMHDHMDQESYLFAMSPDL